MRYRVSHVTSYRYSEEVTLCHNEVRMTPRAEMGQRVLGSHVTIDPMPNAYAERNDFFDNRVVYFDVEDPHAALTVSVESEVETSNARLEGNLLDSVSWETVRDGIAEGSTPELRDYLYYMLESPMVPRVDGLEDLQVRCFTPGRSLFDAAHALMRAIYKEFRYDPTATTIATPLAQVLASKRGVCQDFAHVAIAVLRQAGLAAGYVSGYLETQPPPGQVKLRGSDASHAWFSVFFPGIGWVDFDPTNDQQPNERYVVVARGRDYGDVSPLKGIVFGGGSMSLHVAVDVEPIA
jgi:transglutaminase-like putative cysteine protease